jgi:hypothetical protein
MKKRKYPIFIPKNKPPRCRPTTTETRQVGGHNHPNARPKKLGVE